ncbi:MAG: JAB domain-containing protein [Verrucomicrobiae bacterium]|nr:JAB domain-containing protein [Verrucomicrobiae bacterium]
MPEQQATFSFYTATLPHKDVGGKVRESAGCSIRELPFHDQPRERLERLGATSLTDAELLAVLLGGGNSRPALDMAHDLLKYWGGLEQLARQSVAEIAKISGIGRCKAMILKAAFSLQERLQRPDSGRCLLNHPASIYELMKGRMALLEVEVLYGLALDAKLRLIRAYPISTGLVNQTLVHAREAYREAISVSASHLALVHNHPSGDCSLF